LAAPGRATLPRHPVTIERVAVREIVTIGHPMLRERAREVTAEELALPGIQALVDDLVETMRAANGAGLAAPQIAVPLRVFVVEVRDNPRYPYKPNMPLRVLVNPIVRPVSDETFEVVEGCLSIPGLRGRLRRDAEVEIAYLDRDGAPHVEEIRGLSAGTFQHEQDHLDGILFVDRVADPRTLTTWESWRAFHEEAFVEEARTIVDRWGS
jgi:peptide deformylase